jgi:hypothetical protein
MQGMSAKQDTTTRTTMSKRTFWPKRNTDSVCKHVNAFKDFCVALIGELDRGPDEQPMAICLFVWAQL